MCFHINPAAIDESVTQGSLLEEESLTSQWQNPYFKKEKCSRAPLLPQYVEMQCEKGIKPQIHKGKSGEVTVTAPAKPAILYIHTQSNAHTQFTEIL